MLVLTDDTISLFELLMCLLHDFLDVTIHLDIVVGSAKVVSYASDPQSII